MAAHKARDFLKSKSKANGTGASSSVSRGNGTQVTFNPNKLEASTPMTTDPNITVLPVKPGLGRRTSIPASNSQPDLTVENTVDNNTNTSTTEPPLLIPDVNNVPPETPILTMAETLILSQGIPNRSAGTHNFKNPTPLFPGKDQAVIVQSIDGLTIAQYLRAMANIVGGKNILFASRMSLGRVGFYFTSVKLVNSFMIEHGGVSIGDQFLPARRMVTPAERLVLSNVCPSIPHEAIESTLSTVCRLVSPMNFISLGNKDRDLGHVFSFRRQIFVVRPEGRVLPESIQVDFGGEKYRVFLSFDDLQCFKCKKAGHIARNCPKGTQDPSSVPPSSEAFPSITSMEKRKGSETNASASSTAEESPPKKTANTEISTVPTLHKARPPPETSATGIDLNVSVSEAMMEVGNEPNVSPMDDSTSISALKQKRRRSPETKRTGRRLDDASFSQETNQDLPEEASV